jgi:hypothetical protein
VSSKAGGLRRGLAVVFLFIPPTMVACGRAAPAPPVTAGPSDTPRPQDISPAALQASFYGDAGSVRFAGPPGVVLVRKGSRPFVTARQYNAWLGTYPLKLTSKDPDENRRQALEQMVTYKLLAQKARESGYERKMGQGGGTADERSMVIQYIKDQVSNTNGITDADVKAYEILHPEYVASLDASSVPGEFRGMVLRGSVAGERLWERVKSWMKEERIQYVKSPR